MAIKTQQSVSGFIVGFLKLDQTSNGDSRFTARVGQDRFERLENGEFRELDPEYFNIVQFRKAADRSFAAFKPGDRFVAEGYTREFSFTGRDGAEIAGEEFVVKKIGHDTARTNYDVIRKEKDPEVGRDTPAQDLGHHPDWMAEPDFETPGMEPSQAQSPAFGQSSRQLPNVSASGMSRQAETAEAARQLHH